jgi:hypothetical protein
VTLLISFGWCVKHREVAFLRAHAFVEARPPMRPTDVAFRAAEHSTDQALHRRIDVGAFTYEPGISDCGAGLDSHFTRLGLALATDNQLERDGL